MNNGAEQKTKPRWHPKRIWKILGPGITTGAADDDPSGIATYSIVGAQFGTSLLWIALFSWPLMAGVQMMCARIGMVSGRGLAASFRRKFPRPVLVVASLALLIANTLNVGADLAGMADAGEMLTGINSHILIFIFAIGISWATIRLRYHQIANVLKWLVLILFAYAITAFHIGPNWKEVFKDLVIPSMPHGREAWATVTAILGTTISPYLFFWQASQEVEEEKAIGRKTLAQRRGATDDEILDRKLDVCFGTFFSNLIMFFIIVTTTLTLHRHGILNIETSKQASEALAPLAGKFASMIYTIGIVGAGLLAIPTLTGSAAYAFAETFAWTQGLDARLRKAKAFYTVILLSTAFAVALDFSNINPIRALYWSAILNGLLAPFLLVGIVIVASDKRFLAGQPSSLLSRGLVSLTAVIMFAVGIAMFVF